MFSSYLNRTQLLETVKLKLEDYIIKPIENQKFIDINKNIVILENNLIWNNLARRLSHNEKEIVLTKKENLVVEFLSSSKIILYIQLS